MFARIFAILAIIASVAAFAPSRRATVSMSMQNQIQKALAVGVMGFALAAPVMPAFADGAVSKSSVYRARNTYGRRIVDLTEAAAKVWFTCKIII